ncbi:MAG: NAD(P)-dependent oxidoreductase [Candidatus Stahlbacteria bacterium]|nr:NAD(P)-dependent oxidoreductase [Candidatus Stahlbacteria bacterium]
MKVLVTGAGGFIGSHLVESLIADGDYVRCFVKPCSDISPIESSGNDIVYGDIRDIELLKKVTEDIDIVYHLAAIPRLKLTIPPEEYKSVNIEGTRNVLEMSRRAGTKKFVYISTIEAVGPSRNGNPVNEETEPKPENIYGGTKLEGEKLTVEYYKTYGMHTVIVRPPMIYGPGSLLQFQRLFKVINKGCYPIVGDGKTLMEFCYVENLVFGIKLAGEKGRAGEIYFISDERSYSIEEVVREIGQQLNTNTKIFYIPVRVAWGIGLLFEGLSKIIRIPPFRVKETNKAPFSRDTVKWTSKDTLFCDVSKAKRELGYIPPYTLSEGIKKTIKWYKVIGLL